MFCDFFAKKFLALHIPYIYMRARDSQLFFQKNHLEYCVFRIFFVFLQPKTKNTVFLHMKPIAIIRHLLLFSVLLCTMVSCDSFDRGARHLQRQLHLQQQRAEQLLDQVSHDIEAHDFDSLHYHNIMMEDILLYVFHDQRLVYWGDSWLSSFYLPLRHVYNQWQYAQWDNAQGVCYLKRVGDIDLLVVIPIKYAYRVTSESLTNNFIAPFQGELSWGLTPSMTRQDSLHPIYSHTGEFLFSLSPSTSDISQQDNIHIHNFSYQSLLASEKHEGHSSRSKLLLYYGVTLFLIFILLLSALYHLIKSGGFRNMNLAGRLQMILTPVMLLALASTFILSVLHIRTVFVQRQQEQLSEKAHHIQQMLKTMYFWDMELDHTDRNALHVDLRDMSFDFETDIHVYDLSGHLLGTSCPELFDLGVVSRYMSPQVLFSQDKQMVRYEHIGDVRYLSAYTHFVNGSFVQIGYIVIPSFISQEAMNAELEKFVIRLLPLYIILLLFSIVVVWLVARGVASPLVAIGTQIKNYRLGETGQHISYFFHDEVGDLIQHYNDMMDALADSSHRLARSEREGAWRTMARQVAHEINNPLTPMKLTLQQLQRHKGTERFDEYFDRSTQLLIEQIETLGHIATSFSSFAKMPEVNPTQVDVAKKLHAFIMLMRNNDNAVPIRYVGPEQGVAVIADAEQITQVFANILRNALQALEGQTNGDIIVILKPLPNDQRLAKGLDEQNQWIEISISDNGPGIPEEIRDKVFVPNFTTKNTGAGLGLAISKNIIDGSGGKITFHTSEKGTTFFVYLKKIS